MSPISNPAPSAGATIELGELNLTPDSLLHTTSGGVAEAIADVAAGQCLISQGVSSIPTYSTSPIFTGLTLSGLTLGSVPFAGAGGLISEDNANLFWDDTDNRLGVGTLNPQAKLEVGGNPGTSVGGFPSGNLHVTGQSALVNANAVITGHNLFGGNKQLWYLGSVSGGNDNIAFINRQAAALSFSTNSTERVRIDPIGNVGVGLTNPGVAATADGRVVLHLANATTVPVGALTGGGALFYATGGEMRVVDAAGNDSLLSPHDPETNEWIYQSVRNRRTLKIRMEAFMRKLEEHFGWGLIEEFTTA